MDIVLLATLDSHSTCQVEPPLTLRPDRPLPTVPSHYHQLHYHTPHTHHALAFMLFSSAFSKLHGHIEGLSRRELATAIDDFPFQSYAH